MGKQIHVDYDFTGGAKITGLPASAANGQPVVHEQLAAAIEGVSWKDSVRVSTQGNINLASPGAAIDGVTMAGNDRVLVRAQTASAENGVYIWNGAAVAMTRAADASTFAELEGAVVPVEEGTDAGVSYRQTQVNGMLGTDDVVFVDYGTAVPVASETTAGKIEIATQVETNTGTDDTRAITPLKLKNSDFAKRKHSATFGDGSATQFDFTHNFGTLDVLAGVRLVSTGADIDCAIARIDANTVRVNLASAPANNALRITIIG